jgi:hypothetical protein
MEETTALSSCDDSARVFANLDSGSFEEFVASRQEEGLSLEFKSVADAEFSAGSDRKHLAEVLSGFANSAGGIVVWGIRTEKVKSGQDVAAHLAPIANVRKFVARLEEATPLVVTPPVEGIAHRAFELPDGSGYAATFVPESDIGPHMALLGHDRYFKRANDRFYQMAHFDVADLFGRRQRAALRLKWELEPGKTYFREVSHAEIRIILSIVNDGRASAVAPFLRIQTVKPFAITPHGISSGGPASLFQFQTEYANPPSATLIGKADLIVHPKVSFQVAALTAEMRGDERVAHCDIEYAAAALNTALATNSLFIEPLSIASTLGRTVHPEER